MATGRGLGVEDGELVGGVDEGEAEGHGERGGRPGGVALPAGALLGGNGDGEGGGAALAPGGGDLLEAGEGRAGEGDALGAEGAGGEVSGGGGGEVADEVVVDLVGREVVGREAGGGRLGGDGGEVVRMGVHRVSPAGWDAMVSGAADAAVRLRACGLGGVVAALRVARAWRIGRREPGCARI